MLTHFQCQTDGEEKVHRCILMRQKYVGGSRERDSERGGGGGGWVLALLSGAGLPGKP